MVAGIDVDLFRPDEELKKLAQLAVDLGIGDRISSRRRRTRSPRWAPTTTARSGWRQWEAAHDPWFNFSAGSGFYHSDKIWAEYPDIPMNFIESYVAKLGRGESLARPIEAIEAERDRIVAEYTELIDDDEDRATFEGKLGLARTVFPYVENHNFYVEHWGMSLGLGQDAPARAGPRRPGLLGRRPTTSSCSAATRCRTRSSTTSTAGRSACRPAVRSTGAGRSRAAAGSWTRCGPGRAPPALGVPPEVITEPFSVMLWGVTSDSVKAWLGGSDSADGTLTGFAASPGIAEGPARVILGADGISRPPGGRDPRGAADRPVVGAGVRQDRAPPSPTSAGS